MVNGFNLRGKAQATGPNFKIRTSTPARERGSALAETGTLVLLLQREDGRRQDWKWSANIHIGLV